MEDFNALDVLRQDIRDLRLHLDLKFSAFDARLREVEQQAASSRTMARVGLGAVPFGVVAFSFSLIRLFGS